MEDHTLAGQGAGHKIPSLLNRMFLVVFFGAMLVILYCVITADGFGLGVTLLALALLGGWLCLLIWGAPRLERVNPRLLTLLFYLLALGLLAAQLAYGRGAGHPRGDPEAVYTGVWEAVQYGKLEYSNTYFLVYPHQRGFLMVMFLFNYLLRVLGIQTSVTVYTNIVFTSFCVTIAIVLAFHAAKRLWGAGRAFCAAAPLFTYLPFATKIRLCYSYTIGTLFIAVAFWLYVMAATARGKKAGIILYALAGAAFAFTGQVVGVGNIVLVAVLIHLCLTTRPKALLKALAAFVAGFLVLYFSYQAVLHGSGIIDFTDEDKHRFPITYWLLVAMQADGQFLDETYWVMDAAPDYQTRYDYTIEALKEELSNMTAQRFFSLHASKTTFAWAKAGSESVPWKALRPLLDARHLCLLLCIGVSGVLAFRRKTPGWDTLFQLLILGFFLFGQVWETRADNLFAAMPLLCIGMAALDPAPIQKGAAAIWRKVRRVPNEDTAQ